MENANIEKLELEEGSSSVEKQYTTVGRTGQDGYVTNVIMSANGIEETPLKITISRNCNKAANDKRRGEKYVPTSLING